MCPLNTHWAPIKKHIFFGLPPVSFGTKEVSSLTLGLRLKTVL